MESNQRPAAETEKKELSPHEARRERAKAAVYLAAVQRSKEKAPADAAESPQGTSSTGPTNKKEKGTTS